MVALPYTWTEKKGLPDAQVFPWDHDQGLYVLNGYHALHCLVSYFAFPSPLVADPVRKTSIALSANMNSAFRKLCPLRTSRIAWTLCAEMYSAMQTIRRVTRLSQSLPRLQ